MSCANCPRLFSRLIVSVYAASSICFTSLPVHLCVDRDKGNFLLKHLQQVDICNIVTFISKIL